MFQAQGLVHAEHMEYCVMEYRVYTGIHGIQAKCSIIQGMGSIVQGTWSVILGI